MPNDTPARPRLRLRYLFALLAAVAAAPLIAFQAWSGIEAARLDRAFDALEAGREPLDLAAFGPQPVTADQKQASHLYAQAGKLVDDVSASALAPAGATIEALCASPQVDKDAQYIAELKSIEQRYATVFDLLDRAAALEALGWDEADRPRTFTADELRAERLNDVNAIRVGRMACGDEPGRAAAALLSSLRIGRLPAAGPGIRRLKTTHGLQSILSKTAPSPALLTALQQEYERDADEKAVEKALIYLRARWLSFATPGVFSDAPAAFTGRRITPFEAVALRLSRPLRDHTVVTELREFDEVIAAARMPWPKKLDEAARFERQYPLARSRGSAVTNIMNPYGTHVASGQFQFILPSAAEALARGRASIGAIAIERWRADHAGALPASLTDLVPAYVAAPLTDPYTGEELKYIVGRSEASAVHAAATYKVYSVGPNRKDDGGLWEQHSDLQRTRRGDPADVGVAVSAPPAWPKSFELP